MDVCVYYLFELYVRVLWYLYGKNIWRVAEDMAFLLEDMAIGQSRVKRHGESSRIADYAIESIRFWYDAALSMQMR